MSPRGPITSLRVDHLASRLECDARVGAYRQVMYGSIPIGAALAGILGAALGTRTGVLIGAAGLALSALPMLTRRIRTLRTPRPVSAS